MSKYIQNRPVFDIHMLVQGHAVQYVDPGEPMLGESSRTYDCLIKEVTPLQLTLSRLNHQGKWIDEQFSPEEFSDENPHSYRLVNPFAEKIAFKTALKKILNQNSIEEIKKIANDVIQ